jgi:hypothetical protein
LEILFPGDQLRSAGGIERFAIDFAAALRAGGHSTRLVYCVDGALWSLKPAWREAGGLQRDFQVPIVEAIACGYPTISSQARRTAEVSDATWRGCSSKLTTSTPFVSHSSGTPTGETASRHSAPPVVSTSPSRRRGRSRAARCSGRYGNQRRGASVARAAAAAAGPGNHAKLCLARLSLSCRSLARRTARYRG